LLHDFSRGGVEHSLPNGSDNAAELRVAGIGEFGAGGIGCEFDAAFALDEPGQTPAIHFEKQRVRRVFLREFQRPRVLSGDRGNSEFDRGLEAIGAVRIEAFAARKQLGKPRSIGEQGPDLLGRAGQGNHAC